MAEQNQPLILALGRGYNGFYCPKTRFHLVGVIKPSARYPEGLELSEDVKRGLRGGTLVDVNKVLKEKDLEFKVGEGESRTSADLKNQILVQAEEAVKKQKESYDPEEHDGQSDDTYVSPDFKDTQGELLSEADILSATKKQLQEFIENQEIDMDALELNSRSTAEDFKNALIKHFGYDEKPQDFNDEK